MKNINRNQVANMMFTDERIFTRNGYFNLKNNVVWEESRTDVNESGGTHEREKYPGSVMVASDAAWNDLTELYFV